MHPSQMDYVRAALAQAYYSDMDLVEVLRVACDCDTIEQFDSRIQTFCDFTIEPPDDVAPIAIIG